MIVLLRVSDDTESDSQLVGPEMITMSSTPRNTTRSSGTTPRNSINLDESSLRKLLDALDAKKSSASINRQFVRWPYRVATVELRINHDTGTSTVYVACRNLSAGGVAILHRAFLHTGTSLDVALPKVNGDRTYVPGKVVRCQHLAGTVHEIGVKFEKPIEAKDYVRIDPFADGFSLERVNPEDLKGTILYVADTELDQSLMRQMMRETSLRVLNATDRASAAARASEAPDLIIIENTFESTDCGANLCTAFREAGVDCPILIATADTSTLMRAKLANAAADAFLPKPIRKEVLFRALAEFLLRGASSTGCPTCSLPQDDPHRALLPTFASQLKAHAAMLEKAIQSEDVELARSICFQIAGSAPLMGFERLSASAEKTLQVLSSSMNVGEALTALKGLSSACLFTARKAA